MRLETFHWMEVGLMAAVAKESIDDAILLERCCGGIRVSVIAGTTFWVAAVVAFSLYHQSLPAELKLPSLVWFVLAMLAPGVVVGFHAFAMCCYRLCVTLRGDG